MIYCDVAVQMLWAMYGAARILTEAGCVSLTGTLILLLLSRLRTLYLHRTARMGYPCVCLFEKAGFDLNFLVLRFVGFISPCGGVWPHGYLCFVAGSLSSALAIVLM